MAFFEEIATKIATRPFIFLSMVATCTSLFIFSGVLYYLEVGIPFLLPPPVKGNADLNTLIMIGVAIYKGSEIACIVITMTLMYALL